MSNLPQLRVTFDSFDDLVESIGPGLSRTHLFARTDEVIDDGTRVRLEIGTVRKGALIRGVAKVAGPGEAATRPGLYLHIIHLDPSSTRLVDSIVRGEVSGANAGETSGPSPFDIPHTKPVHEVEEIPQEAARPPASAASDRFRRFGWPLALAALAGVFLLIFAITTGDGERPLLTGSDRKTETETGAADPAASAREPETEADPSQPQLHEQDPPELAAPELAAPELAPSEPDPLVLDTPEPDPLEPERITREVEDTVRSWAAAWSRQDPTAYLELYAPDYSPSGLDRETWQRQRQTRITAPERVEISVSELKVEVINADRAIVRFHQLYETDEKALAARKALELERFTTSWKIVAERVEP